MVNTIILKSSIKPHTKWALAECLMCVESTLVIEIRICGGFHQLVDGRPSFKGFNGLNFKHDY